MVVSGRFRVVEILDEASMSIVARAESPSGDVALKLLHPELGKEADLRERFRREASALSKLRSEHVVRVLEVVEHEGLPCMVMEYLAGDDLDRVLEHSGPLAVEDAVSAIHQACEGIAEAHALGILHRDLKPANLVQLPDGLVKVIDFGIAKSTDSEETSLTGTGSAMGSPLYMSPEQLRQEKLDARVDVWGLGVTLYELLVGVTPFESEMPAMVLAGIFSRTPPSIRDERDDVTEALEALVFRCLAKDRGDRFASVTALAEALEPYAG
ncbi:MAG: serine/threonine-protein kinase [Polyangiales bacterium]